MKDVNAKNIRFTEIIVSYFQTLADVLIFPIRGFKKLISGEKKSYEGILPFLFLAGIFKRQDSIYASVATMGVDFIAGSAQFIQNSITGFFLDVVVILILAAAIKIVAGKRVLSWDKSITIASYIWLSHCVLVIASALVVRLGFHSLYLPASPLALALPPSILILQVISHYGIIAVYFYFAILSLRDSNTVPSNETNVISKSYSRAFITVLYFILLPLFILTLDGMFIYKNYDNLRPLAPGDTAENFSLADTHGKTVSLDLLKNKVVLIDFFATWCSACKQMNPVLQSLYERFKDNNDVAIIGIDVEEDDSLNDLRNYAMANSLQFPLLQKKRGSLKKYRVNTLPTFCVIDRQGKVIKVFIGTTMENSLGNAIESALKNGD